MITLAPTTTAPTVKVYSGRQESFYANGPHDWRRMTAEDTAKAHTGYDSQTREPRLGVYILPRPNGLARMGYDNSKLGVNVREDVLERMAARWREQVATLPKTQLRRLLNRAHFCRTFVRFDTQPENVNGWTRELDSILSSPESYEPV
jgi:hypothetical protein